MEQALSNEELMKTQLNTLKRSRERHLLGCALAGIYGFIFALLLLALIGSGEPLAVLLIFGVFFAIMMFLYHSQKVTEIDKDIINLKNSLKNNIDLTNKKSKKYKHDQDFVTTQ
jgi:hypothetical protein